MGVDMEKAPKRREQGILQVKEALRDKTLLVCESCVETIREFQVYRWGEYKLSADRTPKEKPEDKDDHMLEDLYRLLLIEPRYVDPKVYEKPINSYQYV